MPELMVEISSQTIEEAIADRIKHCSMSIIVKGNSTPGNDADIKFPTYDDLKDKKVLSPAERKYIIGQRYLEEKQTHGGDRKSNSSEIKGKTRAKIAKETDTSESYVRRAADFAKRVSALKGEMPIEEALKRVENNET